MASEKLGFPNHSLSSVDLRTGLVIHQNAATSKIATEAQPFDWRALFDACYSGGHRNKNDVHFLKKA